MLIDYNFNIANMSVYKKSFLHAGMFIAAIGVFTIITMLLWNWLMPGLFGVQYIDFWQTIGLLILTRLLFGWGRHMPYSHHHGMRKKWAKMTPEERKEFSQKFRHHNHFWEEPYKKNEQNTTSSL